MRIRVASRHRQPPAANPLPTRACLLLLKLLQGRVPGELMEVFAEKMLQACHALLGVVAELKRNALLNDVVSRNAEVAASGAEAEAEAAALQEQLLQLQQRIDAAMQVRLGVQFTLRLLWPLAVLLLARRTMHAAATRCTCAHSITLLAGQVTHIAALPAAGAASGRWEVGTAGAAAGAGCAAATAAARANGNLALVGHGSSSSCALGLCAWLARALYHYTNANTIQRP